MTKTMKKTLALVLSVVMIMSMMPMMYSFAAVDGDFVFNALDETTAEVIGYKGSATEIIIPEKVKEYTVVTVRSAGSYPFNSITNIISVVIPDTVQTIEKAAFRNCSSLKTITIGANVESIGDYAFGGCGAIETINYKGTKAQWENLLLKTGKGNNAITSSSVDNYKINFNYGYDFEVKGHGFGDWTYAENGRHKRVCEYNPGHIETLGCADTVEDADCLCDVCGAVVDHQFGVVVDAVIATCGSAGNEAYKQCNVCMLYFAADAETSSTAGVEDESAFDTLADPTNHIYEETFTVDTQATCSTVGEKSRHCTNSACQARNDVTVIQAREHHLVIMEDSEENADASCTETGKQAKYCDNAENAEYAACDYTIVEEVAAKKHSFGDVTPAKEATCTSKGHYAYKKCSECKLHFAADAGELATGGKEYAAAFNIQIDNNNHDFNVDFTIVRKATCTEDGSKIKYCARNCGATAEETVITARKHNLVDNGVALEAKCLTVGTMNQVCANAEATAEYEACTYTATKDIPATGHTFGEIVAEVPATCSAIGYRAYRDCTVCLKHFEIDADVKEKDGKSTLIPFETEINPNNHKPADEYTIDTAPNCFTVGSKSKHCTLCGEKTGITEIPATGNHTFDKENGGVVTTPATCTVVGVKTFTCTLEGCEATTTEDVPATGHSPAEPVKENEVPMECDKDGSYDMVVYCATCDEELSRETETVAVESSKSAEKSEHSTADATALSASLSP